MLAGKITNHLDFRFRHNLWSETLTAITEHDDEQLNFIEKNYLSEVEVGVPLNFTENKVPNQKVLERAQHIYHSSLTKSKWTALMVYLHLDFLNVEMEYGPMHAFLKKSTIKRVIYKLYERDKNTAEESYQILRFCD